MTADDFCTLCSEPLDRARETPIEVKLCGPDRRFHAACWEAARGVDDAELMRMVVGHEDAEGITPWELGLPDRSGAAAYAHIVRGPFDPQRSPRPGRRGGRGADAWKAKVADPAAWRERIVGLLLDGTPRTFNAICVELADVTADVAFREAPDQALWELVEWRLLQWSARSPVRFRVNPDPPALLVGSEYARARGGAPVRVDAVHGGPGGYWYSVSEPYDPAAKPPKLDDVFTYGQDGRGPVRSYDQHEHALVAKLVAP